MGGPDCKLSFCASPQEPEVPKPRARLRESESKVKAAETRSHSSNQTFDLRTLELEPVFLLKSIEKHTTPAHSHFYLKFCVPSKMACSPALPGHGLRVPAPRLDSLVLQDAPVLLILFPSPGEPWQIESRLSLLDPLVLFPFGSQRNSFQRLR